MIFFDWPTVYLQSQGYPSDIIDIIAYITFRPLAKNNLDARLKKYGMINWKGQSFLVNPKPLIINRKKVSEKELAEYVALASFRNYSEYKVTKRKTLLFTECPVSAESLNENRLLTLQNDQIYFCWEEVTH